MANILEFIRSVLTDAEANAAFREAPREHLTNAGFVDLTGEDVATAIDALRSSLPATHASAVDELGPGRLAAEARPSGGEDELDAAARVLTLAVEAVPAPSAGRRRTTASRPKKRAASAGASTGDDEGAGTAAEDAAAPPAAPDLSALPSVESFRQALESAAAKAAEQAESLVQRIAELFTELDGELAELRAAATAEVEQWRNEAESDREAARVALSSIDADAEALRQKAAANAEQIEADARAAAEAAEADLEARRAELERAEARLQDRVANIDVLLKSVLADEPADPGVGTAV